MRRLIECVPNFSEGRDASRIAALAASMTGVPEAWVLDRHSDADHNRTVITLAGAISTTVHVVPLSVDRSIVPVG